MRKLLRWKRILILFSFICLFLQTKPVFAETNTIQTDPGPNQKLTNAPSNLSMTFSAQINKEKATIQIFDEKGTNMVKGPIEFSNNETTLSIQLPPLTSGIYTVIYYIPLHTGEVIRDSYIFTIDTLSKDTAKRSIFSFLSLFQLKYDSQFCGNIFATVSNNTWIMLLYFMSVFQYVSIIALIGWIIWGSLLKSTNSINFKRYQTNLFMFQLFFLLATLLLLIIQSISTIDFNMNEKIVAIPIDILYGVAWILLLSLAFMGFFFLSRSNVVCIIWVIFILFVKSMTAYTLTIFPSLFTIVFENIYLYIVTILGGGYLFITVFQKQLFIQSLLFKFHLYACILAAILFTYNLFIYMNLNTSGAAFFTIQLLTILLCLIHLHMFIKQKKNSSLSLCFQLSILLCNIIIHEWIGFYNYLFL
ncbi:MULTISPECIES: copper resistance CopC family protein [Bacillus]|uniref:copper resistance CopC family protein n=1 Tax=Bacillus TaxID=1386 RepID=UPI00030F5A27|nr:MULTISPECIES: copper resistance protein CopC [Bacillus]MBO1582822.1 copper resistance protein CopC [Bacillus sp. XF8]MBY0598253.1 copper resistance protein CopC [Bacillus bingmayongensis]